MKTHQKCISDPKEDWEVQINLISTFFDRKDEFRKSWSRILIQNSSRIESILGTDYASSGIEGGSKSVMDVSMISFRDEDERNDISDEKDDGESGDHEMGETVLKPPEEVVKTKERNGE
jgi:hypothetical protein